MNMQLAIHQYHIVTSINCALGITGTNKKAQLSLGKTRYTKGDTLYSSTLTHSQCDAGNITFCDFCCF